MSEVGLQTMREQREAAKVTILQLRDKVANENRDFTPEERSAWDKANADFDGLGGRIEVLERGDAVAKALEKRKEERPGDEDDGELPKKRSRKGRREDSQDAGELNEARALATHAWFLRNMGQPISKKHRRACERLGFNPSVRHLDVMLPRRPGEIRAQGVSSGAIGGHLVPTELVTSLEKAMKLWNGMRQVAQVIRTDAGNPMDWPTINESDAVGELIGENTAVSDGTMTVAKQTWGAYKFSSKMIKVSTELEEDSAIDLVAELGALLGERIGRSQEGYFTTGTGTSQPSGAVTGSALGKSATGATAITADELIDLEHSVDPAYRKDPSFGFMMHDGIIQALRKLKDAENRYLWQPGLQEGSPERLLNRPVTVNQSMQATIAAGTKTILCGAFRYYKIRDVRRIRFRRLAERYADADQTGFIAFMRSDGKILNAGTNPIKHLIQA